MVSEDAASADAGPKAVKLVLITNATRLHDARVRRALEMIDAAGGEIWAKLDAGTEAYYRKVSRSKVSWQQIRSNLVETARLRPIVIQSLFMRIDGEPPSEAEQEAYCDRLAEILVTGQIKLVQIHTIARPPAEGNVAALDRASLETIAERIRRRVDVAVAVFAG